MNPHLQLMEGDLGVSSISRGVEGANVVVAVVEKKKERMRKSKDTCTCIYIQTVYSSIQTHALTSDTVSSRTCIITVMSRHIYNTVNRNHYRIMYRLPVNMQRILSRRFQTDKMTNSNE